jgi:hypothetical protein
MRKALLIAVLACVLRADSDVQGPRAGYIASSTGVRMIIGLVGAARLSEPAAQDLKDAVVLQGSGMAFGISASSELMRVNLLDGASSPAGIKDVTGISSSPSGEVALALAGGSAHLIDKTGARLTSYTLPAVPVRVAVADRGSTIALVTDGGALFVVNETGAREVYRSANLPALAFLPNSTDLVIADEAGGLYRINADLQRTKLATVPGTIALAAQPSRLLAVTEHAISSVTFGTGESTSIDCSCTASFARPLGGSNFLLTSPDNGPIWVLDASSDQLRVAFIPEAVNE